MWTKPCCSAWPLNTCPHAGKSYSCHECPPLWPEAPNWSLLGPPQAGLLSSLGTLVSPGWAAVLPGDPSVYFLPERCGVSPSPGKIWLSRWIWLLGPTGLSSRPSGVTVSWTHCSFWTIFPLLTHWKPSSLEGRWAFARCLAGTKAILHGAWEVILVPMQALQMPQTVFAGAP